MKNQQTRWIRFLGGNNLIFTLVVLLLLGLTILLYSQLDFILRPIVAILSAIITPLIISFALYYLLDPIISFFEKRNIKRVWTIIGLYVIAAGFLVWLIIWLLPILQDQLTSLIETIPSFIDTLVDYAYEIANNLSLGAEYQDILDEGMNFFNNIEASVMDWITKGFSGIGNIISGLTNIFVILLMVPIILFFMLKDGAKFIEDFMEKMPPTARDDIESILKSIDTQVGGYIKGQILVAITNGVLMFIGFTIIGLNYSGILAVLGGFLSLIPYLGPTLTFVPAAIIALSNSWFMLLKLIIVWAIVQFVEGNLVEPNVLGRSLNVHPVTIIFILLIMGELLGLVGMVLGVPIYAILKVFFNFIYEKFKRRFNKYYGQEEGEYQTTSLDEIYDLDKD